jgi:hypothetical protein
MSHTPESVAGQVALLRHFADEAGRGDAPIEVTAMGDVDSVADVERWAEAGVDRLIVVPWKRSREAVDGLGRFADLVWG